MKYYLLKKNVTINSETFKLNADEVKINFDKSLYDILEFLYLRSLLERWVSGLNQQFAKLSYVITRTGGSNPPLSAQNLII